MSDSQIVQVKNDGLIFTLPDTTADRLTFVIELLLTDKALSASRTIPEAERRKLFMAMFFGSVQADSLKNAVADVLGMSVEDAFIPTKKGAGK